jgi:RsiW-degrading membrane proteinase PrsW (M82 family)
MIEKISILIFSLLPAIVYGWVVYITIPIKIINVTDIWRFLIAGFFSIIIMNYVHIIGLDSTSLFVSLTGSGPKTLEYQHYHFFISVAFFEELSKMLAFFIFFYLMVNVIKEKLHPIAIMFYCGVVGLGFAVLENVSYAERSLTPFVMLGWRSVSPILMHMICGFFMGYWISLGHVGPRMYNRSYFDILVNKREKLRKFIYTFIGLFTAMILHGVYDLNLMLSGSGAITGNYILIILSLLGVLYCFKHIYNIHNKKLQTVNGEAKNNKKDEWEGYENGFIKSSEEVHDNQENNEGDT